MLKQLLTQDFARSFTRYLMVAVGALVISLDASAASFFVRDTVAESGATAEDAIATTTLVRNAVSARASDQVSDMEAQADYILQPKLMRLGEAYVLTVEKIRGGDTLFAAQAKANRIDQLDQAVKGATLAAIDEPSARAKDLVARPAVPFEVVPAQSAAPAPAANAPAMGASNTGRVVQVLPTNRKQSYWTLGAGPFVGRQMKNDNIMYDIAGGHVWDINPRAAVKVIGEINLSSGAQTGHFLNFSTGMNYFLPSMTADSAPYLTGDFGYGFARAASNNSAEGFSIGVGAGYQLFRTTETTLDLLLRYNTIFATIPGEDANPSVVGARVAVNF